MFETDQPSAELDSKFQELQAGCWLVLQLSAFLVHVYAQALVHAAVAFGLLGQFPAELLQVPFTPSDFPQESGALQLGALQVFELAAHVCPVAHCDVHTSEFLSEEHWFTEQFPQEAPLIPVRAVQPPQAFRVGPLQDSEFLSALQA